MNEPHVKELLSSFMDGALGDADGARVDEHLKLCEDCRLELEALRRVSKAVGGLPKVRLPDGFLTRLERRRREAEAEAYRKPANWLPGPTRLIAFAAAGLLLGLLFVRETKYRIAARMMGSTATIEPIDSMKRQAETGAARGGPVEADAFDAQGLSGSAAADIAAVPSPALSEASGRAGGALAVRGARMNGAAGAPIGKDGRAAESYSNEQLQGFLQDERERLGVAKIIPQQQPGSAGARDEIPDRPLNKAEAKEAMMRMASEIQEMNMVARARMAPTVPLGPGTTPKLLQDPAKSKPLVAAGKPLITPDARFGMIGGSADKKGASGGVTDSTSLLMLRKKADERANRPTKSYPLRRSWISTVGGLGVMGGGVLTSKAEWADLWSRVKRPEALPLVDFDKEMAIVVFGEKSNSGYVKVEISSVKEIDDIIAIDYRLSSDPAKKGPTAPYHIVIVPRSTLQFRFQQVQ